MTRSAFQRVQLSRRGFLGATIVGGLALAACARSNGARATTANWMAAAIAATEAAPPHSGRTVTAALTPQPSTIDLGGPLARTLAYGNAVPGPLIRANIGDELAVTVTNGLDHPTSVHWHGIAIRNDMDGATPATPNIDAGHEFTYRFSVPDAGTYWAHPHTGLDADYGLYLPLIVDDPRDRAAYDAEWIVVLDDWTAGIGKSPQQIYDELRRSRDGRDARHGRHGRRGQQRPAWRGRRGCRLPLLPDQRTHPRRANHFQRQARTAHPDPDHQRRLRHRVSGCAGRALDDRHPHRRLPSRAHRGRRRTDGHGRTLRRHRHRRRRRLPAGRYGRRQKRAGAGAAIHRRRHRTRPGISAVRTHQADGHRRHVHRHTGTSTSDRSNQTQPCRSTWTAT